MKKLALNKEVIANLNSELMNGLKGGVEWPIVRTTTTCTAITNCGQATCFGDTCDTAFTCAQGTCQ